MTGLSVWVDRGGTFTDVVARSSTGQLLVEKLLSDNPTCYDDAVMEGLKRIRTRCGQDQAPLEEVRLGTTVATNALLEKQGAPCGLVITKGFKDALLIGYQNRPDLFALDIQKPQALYQEVIELNERIDAKGQVLIALQRDEVREQLKRLKQSGIRSLAIVLMHSLGNDQHERLVKDIAKDLGFGHVYCSHAQSVTPKLIWRGQSTVFEAYIGPLIQSYTNRLVKALEPIECYFMQSNGGLATSAGFTGKSSLLSGPAGGVVGAVKVANSLGFNALVGFDMGGTSTDVFHFAGDYERQYYHEIQGYLIDEPMLNIHTIAAGGGSMLHYDDERMQVGPQSAGANPGPACYRNDGPLTITDANLMLGKLPIDALPPIFGQNQSLDKAVVAEKFQQLASDMSGDLSAHDIAEGFIDIAVNNMSHAIKKISVDKGIDLSTHVLTCFGGAGAQHACLIANQLGMKHVLVPRLASVLSAFGIGHARQTDVISHHVDKPLHAFDTQLIDSLKVQLIERLRPQKGRHVRFKIFYLLAYQGQDASLELEVGDLNCTELCEEFAHRHQQHYGFHYPDDIVVLKTTVVEASLANALKEHELPAPKVFGTTQQTVFMQGRWHEVDYVSLADCREAYALHGPLLIRADNTTVVVEPGWAATVDEQFNVLLEQKQSSLHAINVAKLSPILLEVFNKSFMHAAELMGCVLEKTAASVNIKERLDYSCALFDDNGGLIANAPHMPVHLGSMSDAVKQVLLGEKVCEGVSYLLNDPYKGGTHLPDLTVVSPVFKNGQLQFFVAARGHHADVGGMAPGSLPAMSQTIAEEGVVFDNFILVANGQFRQQKLMDALIEGGARNPSQNIGDIKAQLAANQKGMLELTRLIECYGLSMVKSYVQHVQDNAQLAVKNLLTRLRPGYCRYVMDGAKHIVVRISLKGKTACFDFTGTSLQQADNFNAPVAVVKACVHYVLRSLVQHDIPLNEGCLKPVEIILPPSSMINPDYPHAVVAGNVETSQAIVNCLYAALGVVAASQGTMNNLSFGNDHYQYYETLCGGSGAGRTFDGCDAVHTHMTNSHLTDPEVLESRFPVRLKEFSIRAGSGGRGAHRGGCGAVRRLVFLDSMTVNMISNHRITAPPGLAGGGDGACGMNQLISREGIKSDLPACFEVDVHSGDELVIQTPGGGGYGALDKP